jgi:uncharacterized protein (TIGR00369 family)
MDQPLSAGFKPIPSRQDHNCFACGVRNPHGLHMRFATNGQILESRLTLPEHHCSWENVAHGGISATLLDEIMGWAAIHLLRRLVLTKTMQVEFLKPVYVGQPIRVTGKIKERLNDREVVMAGELRDDHGNLRARATGTYALIKPKTAQRLKIMGPEAMADFMEIVDE